MEPPVVRAKNQLGWELETRKSVEVRVKLEIFSSDPEYAPKDYDRTEEHYIETALGQRFCERYQLKGKKVVGRNTYFSDGSRCADVVYKMGQLDLQDSVVIRRTYPDEDGGDRMNRPEPINLLYVGREPLHVALGKAASLGSAQVIDRDCDVFVFRKVRWRVPQDHVYYLDRETSIPLKVQAFKDESSREREEPLWTWTAGRPEKVEDHFVTMECQEVLSKPSVTWKWKVESISFNKDYPPSTFWPVVQPGVSVHDFVALKHSRAASDAEFRAGTAASEATVRALPPEDSVATISNVLFGLSVVTLVLGVIFWFRRT
jgi:hypothetical protein